MANFWRLCVRLKRSMACSRRRNGRCEFSARLFSQRPACCSIIGVMGESMEPTLPEGCVILLDRNQRQRREERIFVLRTEDGLVVKRAGKGTGGRWQLVSDHPRWPDAPRPGGATIIGEVRWMAREL